MRLLLLLALLIGGCSRAPADLATISEARSLAGEWALVNEQSARGRLTQTYTSTMRRELREQLQSSASSLKVPNSRYGIEIHALLDEPDNATPKELRLHAAVLKRIETRLESA